MLVDVWMVDALQARPQAGRIEIEDQAGFEPAKLQIRDDLRLMNGVQSIYRLDFEHQPAIDENVNPKSVADPLAAIDDGDSLFDFDRQPVGA